MEEFKGYKIPFHDFDKIDINDTHNCDVVAMSHCHLVEKGCGNCIFAPKQNKILQEWYIIQLNKLRQKKLERILL
jgi:hypothetical protein